jgi:dUTP pyrophosphatase
MCREGVVAMFGTVDCGYRGEIGVTVINLSNKDYNIFVGDRIAQLVLSKVDKCEVRWGKFSDDTDRGTSGFGSTGR